MKSPVKNGWPRFRSHYRPRSRKGWIGLVLFLLLMALAEPPIVTSWANRIEPWILGVPFLYGYLTVVYCLLIALLIWISWQEL